ncbi:MAG: cbb3-type cytochrome oxidase assembly protein CcoS [Cellvibrionaceae bacterium]
MESLFYLIPIALVFVVIAVKVFFWAVDNGQFEDLDTEAQRILFDDDELSPQQKKQPSPSGSEKKADNKAEKAADESDIEDSKE